MLRQVLTQASWSLTRQLILFLRYSFSISLSAAPWAPGGWRVSPACGPTLNPPLRHVQNNNCCLCLFQTDFVRHDTPHPKDLKARHPKIFSHKPRSHSGSEDEVMQILCKHLLGYLPEGCVACVYHCFHTDPCQRFQQVAIKIFSLVYFRLGKLQSFYLMEGFPRNRRIRKRTQVGGP